MVLNRTINLLIVALLIGAIIGFFSIAVTNFALGLLTAIAWITLMVGGVSIKASKGFRPYIVYICLFSPIVAWTIYGTLRYG